jgi:glycosyltransferase involved in cell wall biosynthesis
VLEAASIGVPIVCSSLALEGLSLKAHEHALVGESDEELAGAIVKMIASPLESREIALRAAGHVRKHYSWDANLDNLDSWLDALMRLPKRNVRERS